MGNVCAIYKQELMKINDDWCFSHLMMIGVLAMHALLRQYFHNILYYVLNFLLTDWLA